jgi:hypothetical protein
MATKVVVYVVPAGLHDDVDGGALPIGIHDVTTRKIVEVLAVMHIGPEADGAVGEGALPSFDVFGRKHIYFFTECYKQM